MSNFEIDVFSGESGVCQRYNTIEFSILVSPTANILLLNQVCPENLNSRFIDSTQINGSTECEQFNTNLWLNAQSIPNVSTLFFTPLECSGAINTHVIDGAAINGSTECEDYSILFLMAQAGIETDIVFGTSTTKRVSMGAERLEIRDVEELIRIHVTEKKTRQTWDYVKRIDTLADVLGRKEIVTASIINVRVLDSVVTASIRRVRPATVTVTAALNDIRRGE